MLSNLAAVFMFLGLAAVFAACSGLQVFACALPAGANVAVFSAAIAVEALVAAAVLCLPIKEATKVKT